MLDEKTSELINRRAVASAMKEFAQSSEASATQVVAVAEALFELMQGNESRAELSLIEGGFDQHDRAMILKEFAIGRAEARCGLSYNR